MLQTHQNACNVYNKTDSIYKKSMEHTKGLEYQEMQEKYLEMVYIEMVSAKCT